MVSDFYLQNEFSKWNSILKYRGIWKLNKRNKQTRAYYKSFEIYCLAVNKKRNVIKVDQNSVSFFISYLFTEFNLRLSRALGSRGYWFYFLRRKNKFQEPLREKSSRAFGPRIRPPVRLYAIEEDCAVCSASLIQNGDFLKR